MEAHRHRTTVDAGEPEAIEVSLRSTGRGFTWSIANTSAEPVPVRSVSAVHTLSRLSGRIRMLRNGWQSWSETSVATLGVDTDPALAAGALELNVMSHHANGHAASGDALRSEMATVLADDHDAVLAGFLGGSAHDGTLWLAHGRTGQELRVEAHLGGAVLAPGERRELHEVRLEAVDDPADALAAWAADHGRHSGARADSPYEVGWCSWYHYFENVRQRDVARNLAAAADWPIDTFQLDDGFQSAVGDWLATNEKFPDGLGAIAATVDRAGMRPGLWLAPFLVAPDSQLAARHPDWVARFADGSPLIAMYNAHWGGFVHTLDTSHPEALEHLEGVARSLRGMGFSYLKLDFTYAPGMPGAYHDPSLTPAQRVRAGYDAIRRGAGEDAFLLGCGAPLGACVGVVDGMRIGPDVAPWWSPRRDLWDLPGYMATVPAAVNAWRNTLTRAHLHRRLWRNDPDCVMLRHTDTDLTEEQVRAWAMAVAVSGGMVVLSDDLATLDDRAAGLLEEVLEIGRRSDARALEGLGPRCEDLMANALPQRLSSGPTHLVGDPQVGSARVLED